MVCEVSSVLQEHVSSPLKPARSSVDNQGKIPPAQTPEGCKMINQDLPAEGISSHSGDVDTSLCTPSQDISDLITDLNISDVIVDRVTSTPKILDRNTFPNLMTPVRSSGQPIDSQTGGTFAKVSSKMTTFSVLPTLEAGQLLDNKRNISFSLADVGGVKSQIEELKARIVQGNLYPKFTVTLLVITVIFCVLSGHFFLIFAEFGLSLKSSCSCEFVASVLIILK